MKKKEENKLKHPKILIGVFILLMIILAFITVPHDVLDATDIKDYTDTAKFFAGDYAAKQRASHSILYGLMLSPYVALTDSFFLIKFSSVFFLILLILSIYYISGKDKRTLILALFLPLIWYVTPWISPVPLSALLFLWAYYFIDKYNKDSKETDKGKIRYLIYSGLLVGLASAFWTTVLYLSFFFLITFFYNKKFYSTWIFLLSLFVGFLPALIVDQMVYGFAFYSLIKHISSAAIFFLYNGTYNQGFSSTILDRIIVLIFVPFYSYLLLKKENFVKNKAIVVFLVLTLLFILTNPQIRLLLVIAPIILILIGNKLSDKQFKIQIIIFIILSLLVITPYVIQGIYEIENGKYLQTAITEFNSLNLNYPPTEKIIVKDLEKIEKDYANEIFVVGNNNDDYRYLAHLYWGDQLKEFVSIEDYNLYLENNSEIIKKRISSRAKIEERREVWIEIGIGKNSNDKTDYEAIKYAISLEEDIDLEGFELVKEYDKLRVFEKA
ncbi:hypothetical protein J4408_01890 [Candidatus Pacearchaeota archaeon]|nr:MAG: hypothetical protein UW10_C0007G0008 [Candidatus Magasanikbacteria bacterium GW2011_GWA2_43_9]MBS3071721.1 hypothetical protein [Candidatus Pacearchaeota archaeon]